DYLGTKEGRDKQSVRGAPIRHLTIHISLSDLLLDSPSYCPYHTGWRQDVGGGPRGRTRVKQTGKCVRFHILGAGAVRQGEIKSIKEQSPPGLSGIESFGGPDVLK